MGFLFSSGAKHKIPAITGLQIQTAVNILPIPLSYGCPRIPMNIVYANGFRAVAQKSSGGKGLLSGGKGETTGYKYFATFIGALAEGPAIHLDPGDGGQLLLVYDNQQTYTPQTAPNGKVFQSFSGASDQAPWSYIVSNWPADAFGYKDTIYVGFEDWPLDSSATIPQLNFIFQTLFYATSPLNRFTAPNASQYFLDADPGQVILDFLTDETHGVGFPLASIDTDSLLTSADGFDPDVGDAAISTYTQAIGLAWSVILNNAEPASSILERWCKNLVVAPVWTGSILKFVPYRDTFGNENPGWDAAAGIALKYYKPDIPILFDLTDDDFIQAEAGDDAVVMSRVDIVDIKNTVRLDFRDRTNLFNDSVSEAKDEVLVGQVGPRVERLGTADEFSLISYANVSVQMQLQRGAAVRNVFSFRLPWSYCILDPMDIITITNTVLGLDQFPVRIRTIEEDEKGFLSIVAEEFLLGAGTATVYAHADNTPPSDFQLNIPPPLVNEPTFFEPTSQLRYAQSMAVPTVAIAVSAGPLGTFDPNWGGCNVWLSDDDVTYVQNGTITGQSRMGGTTSTLAAFSGTNPDTVNTLGVDVSESNASLESVTPEQAVAGLSLCALVEPGGDYELLAYTTATLTGPNLYDLTDLYRGLYGTVACAHPSGSKFVRVDPTTFQIPLPVGSVGQTIFAKFPSFNIFNLETQELSDCDVYTYIPRGAGFSVTNNQIVIMLLAGLDVDLETVVSDPLDLNLGGAGACSVTGVTMDLETL